MKPYQALGIYCEMYRDTAARIAVQSPFVGLSDTVMPIIAAI